MRKHRLSSAARYGLAKALLLKHDDLVFRKYYNGYKHHVALKVAFYVPSGRAMRAEVAALATKLANLADYIHMPTRHGFGDRIYGFKRPQ